MLPNISRMKNISIRYVIFLCSLLSNHAFGMNRSLKAIRFDIDYIDTFPILSVLRGFVSTPVRYWHLSVELLHKLLLSDKNPQWKVPLQINMINKQKEGIFVWQAIGKWNSSIRTYYGFFSHSFLLYFEEYEFGKP